MSSQNLDRQPLVVSPATLRKAIGFLALLIPAAMVVGTLTIGGCSQIQNSISHYYYTVMGDVFVAFLISTGVLLLCYKGYDSKDNLVSALAGILVICIALFPTSKNEDTGCVIRTLSDVPARINIHYFSAALFYSAMAYISLFLFTKSAGNKTREKAARNRIYALCGIAILVVLLLIFLEDYVPGIRQSGFKATFWLECVANLAYGTSWLIKGEFLLKDKEV